MSSFLLLISSYKTQRFIKQHRLTGSKERTEEVIKIADTDAKEEEDGIEGFVDITADSARVKLLEDYLMREMPHSEKEPMREVLRIIGSVLIRYDDGKGRANLTYKTGNGGSVYYWVNNENRRMITFEDGNTFNMSFCPVDFTQQKGDVVLVMGRGISQPDDVWTITFRRVEEEGGTYLSICFPKEKGARIYIRQEETKPDSAEASS